MVRSLTLKVDLYHSNSCRRTFIFQFSTSSFLTYLIHGNSEWHKYLWCDLTSDSEFHCSDSFYVDHLFSWFSRSTGSRIISTLVHITTNQPHDLCPRQHPPSNPSLAPRIIMLVTSICPTSRLCYFSHLTTRITFITFIHHISYLYTLSVYSFLLPHHLYRAPYRNLLSLPLFLFSSRITTSAFPSPFQ